MRRLLPLLGMLWLAVACSSAPSTFSLKSAAVDPSYWCPGGAKDAAYDLHGTIQVHNGTSQAVTISSITAEMKLTAVKGNWLEKVGDRYQAENVKFEPDSVGAGAGATLKITIPSACTSAAYGATVSSSGTYQVTMRVTTSTGSYSISAANLHEILTA
jgi:hypothetical protein